MKRSEINKFLEESKNRIACYNAVLKEAERSFRELNSRNMQATLIQIEDFLDSNNLYAFNNWFEGVVWDGPNISRHWVEITLKYPYMLMPEPRAMNRFTDMGVKFSFKESTLYVPKQVQKPDDLDPITKKPKEEEEKIWLVTLKIPRHLIQDPMSDETEEVETVQNLEATQETEAAETAKNSEPAEPEGGLDVEEGGGDDLDL